MKDLKSYDEELVQAALALGYLTDTDERDALRVAALNYAGTLLRDNEAWSAASEAFDMAERLERQRDTHEWLALPRKNCKHCGRKCDGPNDDVCGVNAETGSCA